MQRISKRRLAVVLTCLAFAPAASAMAADQPPVGAGGSATSPPQAGAAGTAAQRHCAYLKSQFRALSATVAGPPALEVRIELKSLAAEYAQLNCSAFLGPIGG